MIPLRRLQLLLALPIALAACAAAPVQPFTPRSVTVLGSGDVLLHPPLWQQAADDAAAAGKTGHDFGPIFAGIATPVAAADIAVCELETPVATPDGPFSGWPEFDVPPQVLDTLQSIGYDACTTASNHTLDKGFAGVVRTLDALDAAGLAHAGSARSATEAARTRIIDSAGGVRVALLAYTYGFNGHELPADKPWATNPINARRIAADAARARRDGADIVVVSMHWGTEYQHEPTRQQQKLARRLLTSSDVDLILGAHAHVVQPVQEIDGKWVVYGMGNSIARHENAIDASREGILAEFTFTETAPHRFRVTRASVIPTWVDIDPAIRLIDLPRALADPATSNEQRETYRRAAARIRRHVDALGAIEDGLVMP